jgi:hypothetical protein
MDFQSADTLVLRFPSDNIKIEGASSNHFSSNAGRQSPLDFLAQASMVAVETQNADTKWLTTLSDGREKITVVPGPSGASVRLHRGNGRLPPIDLSKPFAKKCRNRECNNLGGQPGKPRSIYCSKRCQSREQNLRQGRIKNVRSPVSTPTTPSSNPKDYQKESRSTSLSPRSSPTLDDPMNDADSSSPSPELEVSTASPAVSPVPFVPSPVPFVNSPTPPSPTRAHLATPSPIPPPFSNNGITIMPPTHTLAPSPLNVRLGMTPSPVPLSPSPISMSHSSSFSPVPMTSSIPAANHLSTPIFLPRPSAQHTNHHTFATPSAPAQPKNVAFQSNTFTPPPSSTSPRASPNTTSEDNLTLAPILS